MVALAVIAAMCAGCLSIDEPAPSASGVRATPLGSLAPRDPAALMIAIPSDPQGFLPPASDEATGLLVDLLYDSLYRLDEHYRPQPDLAGDLPQVSADGLKWTIALRSGGFSDGAPVMAADVAFSLQLALSPACPFGRDLCGMATDNVATVTAAGPKSLVVTLQHRYGPLLTGLLARLPVLSQAAVRTATQRLATGAAAMDKALPRRQVTTITDATNQDACLGGAPPFGCKLSDYAATLEKLLGDAGVGLPPRQRFTAPTGELDAEAYAGALLDRVSALDQVLNGISAVQYGAAVTLLDPVTTPLGSGPYMLTGYAPGTSLDLRANPNHVGAVPHIPRISMRIMRDPAIAATAVLTGDADWVLRVESAQMAAVESAPAVKASLRPTVSQRAIVFNLRPGRVYADPAARQAFAVCLDRGALARQATNGRAILAETPSVAGSWAMPPLPAAGRDPAKAAKLLVDAGWTRGADGIFAKGGKRLTSGIAVRPSRADLLALGKAAAAQLAECGIELLVHELDLTGDLLLSQLQWPNDFDTVLLARDLGPDPDHDVQPFESAHATSATNPADANPGGYSSSQADALIAAARQQVDLPARAATYAQLQAVLAADVPYWPIWYDPTATAVATRVRTPAGAVDAGLDRFWWNLESWSLAGS